MKERLRKKIRAITVCPNDTITLTYTDERGKKISVLRENIGRVMTLDEAVIFDVEKGDFKDAADGIGGAFLQTKGKEK